MSASLPEKSVELREGLKNGTLSLRDLDNKQKRRSSKGRRRRSKTKTGRTEKAVDGDTTNAKAMEDPRNTTKASKITKSSKTKTVPKGRDVHLEMNTQHKESEEIVRSILDDVFDTVTRQYIAIEQGVANEQAHALADAYMAAFDEKVVFTRKFYMDQRKETQELLYRAAQENVNDLIIRTSTQCSPSEEREQLDVYLVDFQRSADLDARMRARVERTKAEKMAMQQIMYKTASEIIEDLFFCATNNASKTETGITEETVDGDTTKAQAVEDPRNVTNALEIAKSSKTKIVPKGKHVNLEVITLHNESEEIVRSILDDVFDTVTRQCIAIEHSVANEQAHALVDAYMAAFDERVVFTRKFYMDQRRKTQELLYRAAQENVKDLIIRATAQCNPSQDKEQLHAVYPVELLPSTDFDARMRAQMEQINAEKLAMQQIMHKSASEIVEDLFSCAADNARVQNVLKAEVTNEEEADSEFIPVRGWRGFLCCAKANKLKQKDKKSGLLARLRRLFSRR